jgi:hypothetical protein
MGFTLAVSLQDQLLRFADQRQARFRGPQTEIAAIPMSL